MNVLLDHCVPGPFERLLPMNFARQDRRAGQYLFEVGENMSTIPRKIKLAVGSTLRLVGEFDDPYWVTSLVNTLAQDDTIADPDFLITADTAIRVNLAHQWMTCEGIPEWAESPSTWQRIPEVLPTQMSLVEGLWRFVREDWNGHKGPTLQVTVAGKHQLET